MHLSRPSRRSLAFRHAWSLSRSSQPFAPAVLRPFLYLHDPQRLLPDGETTAGRGDSHSRGRRAVPRRTAPATLQTGIMEQGLRWAIVVDLLKCSDPIDQRHIRGVLEWAILSRSDSGTPQGIAISSLISNIFQHHALDGGWFDTSTTMSLLLKSTRTVSACMMSWEMAWPLRACASCDHMNFVTFRPNRPKGYNPGKTFDFLGITDV